MIIEKIQDNKGWWRIRNTINANNSIFLKFDHDPTQAEVDIIVADLISREIEERAKDKRKQRIIELLDSVEAHMIEYIESNPVATKNQILLEMRNFIQSGVF